MMGAVFSPFSIMFLEVNSPGWLKHKIVWKTFSGKIKMIVTRISVEPACSEQEIVVTRSLWCKSVYASVCLDLSRPELPYLRMDFEIIWHSCSH